MTFDAYLCTSLSSAKIIKLKVSHLFVTSGLELTAIAHHNAGSAQVVVVTSGLELTAIAHHNAGSAQGSYNIRQIAPSFFLSTLL